MFYQYISFYRQTRNEMENNNNIELAEGWFEEDQICLCSAMRNRGVSNEIQQRILERIVERWDATDRHDEVQFWLQEEGINRPEDIIVDWMLTHYDTPFTLEQIQEYFSIGFEYNPIPIQDQAQG
jgi:hypothetical protein